jgi:hypothetical protein
MEQELQEQVGRKNFNSRGFCYAAIGREERFDVSLCEDINWRGASKQLGTLEFTGNRQTSAAVHLEHWKAEVEFDNIPEFRDLRGRCLRVSSGALPLCRLSRPKGSANDSREAVVEVIFAGEQRHLSGKIHFSVNEGIKPPMNWIGTQQEFHSKLIESLSFKTGKGHVILVEFSGLLGKAELAAEDQIELLNSEGDLLLCRIQKEMAKGWIEVLNYLPRTPAANDNGKKQQYWKAGNIRIFSFDEAPQFDQKRSGGDLQPLEALMSKSSTFLGIWRRYRELLSSMNKDRFENRNNSTLTFRAGIPDADDPSCHRVNIANWDAAMMNWGDVKDVPVYVAKDESGLIDETQRSSATLIEVGPMGDARIRWADTAPLDQGVIMVRQEFSLNDSRIENAIYTLEKGLSAHPELLPLLNDPSIADPPRKLSPNLRGSIPYDDAQKEAIFKALGNRSIVAIQGPPGTGKTQVIVGIIRELYRKNRKVSGPENVTPFRVLISSAQNVAVFNAVDLLANEGILIDQRLSQKAKEQPENANRATDMRERASQIAQSIGSRIEKEPHLKFQASQTHVVDLLLRELTLVKNSDSVAASLLSTLEDTEHHYRSLPGELSELIDRTKNQLIRMASPKVHEAASADPSAGMLEAIEKWAAIEVGTAHLPNVTEWEDDFDHIGLGAEFEHLSEIERNHRRARRDGDQQGANDLLIKFQSRSASIRDRLAKPSTDGGIWDNDANDQEAKRMADDITNRLMGYHAVLANQKGGVLTQWRVALEEQPGLWKELVVKYAEIRGATCQMAAPEARREGLGIVDGSYDLVVLDEAARTDPGEILIPLTLGKTLLLVGDQKQLPPFIDDLAAKKLQLNETSGLELLKEQSFFQEVFDALPDSNKTMLNRQYRCHPMMGHAISQAFYDGKLHSGPELPVDHANWAVKKTPVWDLFDNHPLCWVDTDLIPSHGQCDSLNPNESDLALEIISRALPTLSGADKQIGVITFYREQLNHLHAKLEHAVPNHARILELNTVDSFQGKEFPLVILLTSRHDVAQGRVGFLNLPNRVNVAVSRAQCQLVIIGSRGTLLHPANGSQPFKAFSRAAGANLKFAGPDLNLRNP